MLERSPDGAVRIYAATTESQKRERLPATVFILGVTILMTFALIQRYGITPLSVWPLALNVALVAWLWRGRTAHPPILYASPSEIGYEAAFTRRRMPRSELAVIFRGHRWMGTVQPPRRSISCYAFVKTDGRPGLIVPLIWFDDSAMSSMADYLRVPMRGDFTHSIRGEA